MDTVTVDDAEVRALTADFGHAALGVLSEVERVVKRGAQNIKEDLRAAAAGSKHFDRIAPTISYDSYYRFGEVAYEIGPDRDRDGAARVANIFYFGGAHGGGKTGDLDKPLSAEEPNLTRELGRLLDRYP
jgi:hypothetical protein